MLIRYNYLILNGIYAAIECTYKHSKAIILKIKNYDFVCALKRQSHF
jgi:hypothetical protein